MNILRCPLCKGDDVEPYHQDNKREYLLCNTCHLVFVSPLFWLNAEQEKAEYDLHQNDVNDQGYRKFLSRIVDPMHHIVGKGKGLDFGCGPGPALSKMFEELGYDMDIYDPFYFADNAVFNKKYDFITATEVIEHVSEPAVFIPLLLKMIKAGGWIGLMTKLVFDKEAFAKWHYKNDQTHICFFSKKTFEYISEIYCLELTFIGDDVILLHKAEQRWL